MNNRRINAMYKAVAMILVLALVLSLVGVLFAR